jgi:amino acid adenylation domain-containing protein/non-ribosomal peptide synthase protein (TIGR01720 family)
MRRIDISHKNEIVAGQHIKERDYWLEKMSGSLEKTYFPYDRNQTSSGADRPVPTRKEYPLDPELSSRLLFMSNKSHSRLHMILTAGLAVVLSKYTGRGDIIFGTPTVKQAVEAKFINTVLILRNRVDETMTFKDLLMQVKQTLLEAAEHVNYPLETLLYKLGLPVSLDPFPLSDVAVLLENIHDRDYLGDIGFNMIFSFSATDDSVRGVLEYNPELYDDTTMEAIAAHFTHLLGQLVFNVDTPLSEIDVVSAEEKERLLFEFNDTAFDYPREKTIVELFEAQAAKTPGNIAVVCADTNNMSYKDLSRESGRLACVLREKGVTVGSIVGIMMERSVDMIVAMLGIIKAGGAYLPMDPNYPEERNRYILKDCAVKVLITHEELKDKFPVDRVITSHIDHIPGSHQSLPAETADPGSLFYVIYTSGSTGKPKGVLVGQKGFVNLVSVHRELFKEDHTSRMSQVASVTFDAMAFEVWPCLLSGAALYIADNEVRMDPLLLKEWLIENKITVSFQPTVIAEKLLNETWPENGVSLQVLLTAGDRLTRYPARSYPFTLYNLYGPTEDTVWSTCAEVGVSAGSEKSPPIGKPIGNHRVYITGPGLELKPVGTAGELCLAGDGLAAGYLNKPELTSERFPANPFEDGRRLYRTGDLARWLPCGNIEFIGRIDHQVKIRGFRIELGEIENRLLTHEKIKEAVVVTKEAVNGDKYLCAYITGAGTPGEMPGNTELREYLFGYLPDYMIPSCFVQMDKMPLTPSGKTDRKALPEPEMGITGEEYVPPEDETQGNLTEIWQDVLGIDKIGVTDNFFMIGGDSIKAIQIAARLKKYRLELKIDDLFLNPTIKELATHVKAAGRVIDQGTVEGEVPFTPIQHWFFRRNFTGGHHFNHSLILYRQAGFRETFIEKIFDKLTLHHDALRMVYKTEAERTVQWNRGLEGKRFDLEVFTLEDQGDAAAQIETEAQRIQESINLEQGPLVKLGLFKTPQGDHLLIVIHHLVVDGVSWRILLEDFSTAYRQLEKGEDIRFPAKTDSFKSWSEALNRYASTPALENGTEFRRQLDYWKQAETAPVDPLPQGRDIPADKNKTKYAETVSLELDLELTDALLTRVNHAYNTEINDILLTALGLAVKDWSGGSRTSIHLEGHGRESLIDGIDISRTVGWFTSQFPLLLDMGTAEQLPQQIVHVKETLRRIPDRGIGYGIFKYLVEQEKQDVSFDREPRVCFNYLGQFLQDHARADAVFAASPMKTGSSISPESEMIYTLDVRGLIVDGKLKLSFVYNRFQYPLEEIEGLRDACKRHLEAIILHCTQKEGTRRTAGDFSASDLDEEEVEDIFDELED